MSELLELPVPAPVLVELPDEEVLLERFRSA
jgi:hypothetical protein